VFASEIDAHLESADIILLLVSSDFLGSEYCYQLEMQRAVERRETGSATVIPVILRPCDWHTTPFGKLQAAPKDGRPIIQWPDADEAFLDVVRAIKVAIAARGFKPVGAPAPIPSAELRPAPSPVFRSSNLRVAKQFNRLDRDRFVREGFDYVAKFFENSLRELSARSRDVEGLFRRIDANRFTAVAYRTGEKRCQCTTFLGGGIGDISYAMSDQPDTHSFNESLSVDADDQEL
jgi:TIR domain